MTPRFSFVRFEGRVLQSLLWILSFVFLVIMGAAWSAARKAQPVLLDLKTGKPVAERPAP